MSVEIFDSTLRDGVQGERITFTVTDKLKIFRALDKFGIDLIEAGNPFSNPKDIEFFEALKKENLIDKAVAFGSTIRKGVNPQDDENISALLRAGTKHISIFGKAWDFHVQKILGVELEDNLSMVYDTVSYLKSKGKIVYFDAEHFFDGYKNNSEYALSVVKAAQDAGADVVCLCDTNGGAFPSEIAEIVKAVRKHLSVRLGIHCHDDCGCAVASSIEAFKAGADHIQGTFIGMGERCGNTNLSTVIANLSLKMGESIRCGESLKKLTKVARYIADVANIKLARNMPYVGQSAFAHKGGMHADGVAKAPSSFEHTDPENVGNERKLLLSEVSGRAAILSEMLRFDSTLTKSSPETIEITRKVKELEAVGFQFEAATASFDIMVLRELGRAKPHFDIDYFRIISAAKNNKSEPATAMVKVRVGDEYEITADEGDGPVNAIDRALRKALEVFYPSLRGMRLVDYKVRVIGTGESTASSTRVVIESTDGDDIWTTVGASKDIITASMIALTDSLEYMLLKVDGII